MPRFALLGVFVAIVAGLCLTLAGPLAAQLGPWRGEAYGWAPDPVCSPNQPLGPEYADLIVYYDPNAYTDVQWVFASQGNGPMWDPSGIYYISADDFADPIPTAAVIRVYMPTYPPAGPGTAHPGFLLMDSVPSSQIDLGWNRIQEVPRPQPNSSLPPGEDLSWPALAQQGTDGRCELGGSVQPGGFLFTPEVLGYNVYRLDTTVVPVDVSTPMHYLCGPDLDCNTAADNGWVGFAPHAPDANGEIRFTDSTANPSGANSWVIQPVLWGPPTGAWNGIPAEDIDGDTFVEFLDPSGQGRGLALKPRAWPGPWEPQILISADSEEGPCPPLAFPSDITVTALGDCGLEVAWQPATGGSGGVVYDLYRDTASPVPLDPAHLVASDLAVTPYVDTVAWGTDYTYRVMARDHCPDPGPQETPNDGGDSPLTGVLGITFDSELTVTTAGECELLVEWDSATSGQAQLVYDVYRDTGSPVPLDPAYLVAAGLTDASFLDTVPWDAHRYRVVARDQCVDPGPQEQPNGGGDSDPETPVDETPPQFGGITDTEDAGFCNVLVHWDESTAVDACSGVALYTIYRDHGVAHRGETLVGTAEHTPYTDTTPGNGVWVYVVRAVDGAGNEEQNEVFVQESEGSCTNDFPMDAGMKKGKNIDPPNADKQGGILAVGREPEGPPTPGFDSEWLDIKISWEASPDEGGLYPVTYSILRGSLEDLQSDGYLYTLVDPAACGIVENEYIMEDQADGFSYYYVIVPVSGDNATFGYDSRGAERPEVPVCP